MNGFDREIVRRLLERDLVEWADDADLRLVWADLLQDEGDPLGTLVVLDHVGATATGAAAERARQEAEVLRRELRSRLWDDNIPKLASLTLIWRRGFVHEVRIDANKLELERIPTRTPRAGRSESALEWLVPLLLRQPALRWVEIIRIEISDVAASTATRWIADAIYNACVREIHVGKPAYARERPAGAWESRQASRVYNTGGIERFGRLRWFSVAGELRRVPCCDGNTQARLHHINRLSTRPLTSHNRASLARALFDASVLVHGAAFEVAGKLGPQADFLIDDLAWFLRPPLSKKDPRPTAALRTLARIGPAAATLLPELLRAPDDLLFGERVLALLEYLTALGRAAAPASSLLGALARDKSGKLPAEAQPAIARVRNRISST